MGYKEAHRTSSSVLFHNKVFGEIRRRFEWESGFQPVKKRGRVRNRLLEIFRGRYP